MTSHTDISRDVQKGIEKSNQHEREAREDAAPTENERATRFDGNPQPQGDTKGGTFKPRDDTPAVLPKREGPKNG